MKDALLELRGIDKHFPGVHAHRNAQPDADSRGAARLAHAAKSASDFGRHSRLGSSIRGNRLPIAAGRRWRVSAGNCGRAANRLHVYELKGWGYVFSSISGIGRWETLQKAGALEQDSSADASANRIADAIRDEHSHQYSDSDVHNYQYANKFTNQLGHLHANGYAYRYTDRLKVTQ